MDDVIQWILDHTPGFVRDVVNYIATAFRVMWSRLFAFFIHVGNAFIHQFGWIKFVASSLAEGIVAVFHFAIYLLTVRIPNELTRTWNYVFAVVQGWVSDVIALAWRLRGEVVHFAQSIVDVLRAEVTSFIGWVHDTFNSVILTLRSVYDLVTRYLLHPEALADWLAGAMLAAIGRWLLARIVPLARWLWPQLIPLTLESAHIAEDVITKVL